MNAVGEAVERICRRPVSAVSVACPAKVNLLLRILAREDTGYHQIETVFQAVGLFDRVEVRRARHSGTALAIERRAPDPGVGALAGELSGSEGVVGERPKPTAEDIVGDLGRPESNTVARAADAFFAATGIAPRVSVRLVKTIPAGTGLGGGSSDAAGALAGLNALHGEPLAQDDLVALGGRVGSDVPFFCARAPIALGWGRGDRILPLPPRPRAHAALVIPRDRTSTAAAYADTSATIDLPAPPRVAPDLTRSGWDALAAAQHNDFERVAFARTPGLAAARSALEQAGALVARLTGSGAAVFGIFARRPDAKRAAATLRAMSAAWTVLVVPTLESLPPVSERSAPGT